MKSRFWAVALACFLLFCIAPGSALAGSITGKITAVGGAPIPHARACARKSGEEEQLSCAETTAEGEYAINSIEPYVGYKLYFEGPEGEPEYATTYWQEKWNYEQAESVFVGSSGSIEANATLIPGGRIEGTLTAEGEAPSRGEVCAFKHGEIGSTCEFLSHGSGYRIGNLAPGSYVLRFSIPGYLTEFSGGVTEYFPATSVSVQAGGVTAASADLKVAPGIRGTVTAQGTGEPVENVTVCAFPWPGLNYCGSTDEDGNYLLVTPPGTYRVMFEVDGYVTQYYGGTGDIDHGTTVAVAEAPVGGIDAVLEQAGSIKGQVTLNGDYGSRGEVEVCALSATSEECVKPDPSSGVYEFLRIPPGSYKVRFSLGGYFTQFFNDKATEAEAQLVTVTAGQESGGVDATLVAEEAPTNITPPFVSGVGKIGETLSCSNGVWSGNPPIFTYEYFWFRGEEEIEGAESSTYRLGVADAGESISCGVEAINSVGAEYEFSSNEIVAPWLGALSVVKTGGGSGTVSSAPAGIACGVACTGLFEEGTAITLTAVADSGSEFTGWSGACSGTGPCAFTLGEGAEVIANFAKTRSDGGGAHTPSPPATPAPAVRQAKKPLRCKVGFRKEKHNGKIRCVKAKPRHKGSPKANGGRA
ncbi:MAG TPA: carboxypeptidase regulatory-like domain-containing protein [Solirubrobacterales bacterium]|nr:carboxypeptidase regulatory-like domain-containing protein [Solirubrobacterales bacterium]